MTPSKTSQDAPGAVSAPLTRPKPENRATGQAGGGKPRPKGSLGTNVEWGKLVNRIKHLQKAWNFWNPQRQHNPLMSRTIDQMTALRFCERIAGPLHDCKVRKAQIEADTMET